MKTEVTRIKQTNGKWQTSIISIKANLLVGVDTLRDRIEAHPGLVKLPNGRKLRYLFEDKENRFYTIEFGKDRIIIEVHSLVPPNYFIEETLFYFLNICVYLKEAYEVDLKSLYPYFIEVLGGRKLSEFKEQIKVQHLEEDDANIMLAQRINILLEKNEELKKKNEEKTAKITSIISKIIISKSAYDINVDTVANENGLERDDIMLALNGIEKFGYKVMYLGKKEIRLARA